MKEEILVSKVDYSRLNSMILNLLETNGSNPLELNRLNIEIKRATLVDPWKIHPECITMNSVIKITYPGTGASETIRLVYPQDAGLKEGNISILSPLGCALLGYSKGHTVSFNSEGGRQRVIIDEIIFQPEANGEDLQ